MYQVLTDLPQPNRDTLAYLIIHLQRLAVPLRPVKTSFNQSEERTDVCKTRAGSPAGQRHAWTWATWPESLAQLSWVTRFPTRTP